MLRIRRAALLIAPVVILGISAAAPVGASANTAAISPKQVLASLPSVIPGLAKHGKFVSSVSPATPIDFSILVKGPHDAELTQLAQQVSDPTSPDFRHFLTRDQIVAQYDPPPA